jgi:hypothetical protein
MDAHQRDCVAAVFVNGYHRVPLGVIVIAAGRRVNNPKTFRCINSYLVYNS